MTGGGVWKSRDNLVVLRFQSGFSGVCSQAILGSSISHNGQVSSGGVDGLSVYLPCSRTAFF